MTIQELFERIEGGPSGWLNNIRNRLSPETNVQRAPTNRTRLYQVIHPSVRGWSGSTS